MKKKFSKILGVGLALVLVVSLGAFVIAPADASPAANKWAKFSIPSEGSLGDYILVPVGTDNESTLEAGPAYLTKSKDGDLWAYWNVEPDVDSSNLFKSTDEGRSWSKMGSSTSVVKNIDILDIACSPKDNDVVFAASTSLVYKTSDGGSTWAKISELPGGADTITCLDVAYKDGRHYIAAGANNGSTGEVYVKPDIAYETWEAQGMTDNNTVLDVAFSPNFATETNENVVAVTDNGTATFVRHQFGGGDWDTVKAELLYGASDNESFSGIVGADIAFPDDYDSTDSGANAELFVGIDGDEDASSEGGVYYIIYTAAHHKLVARTTTTGTSIDVSSIDLDGSAGDCCILAADAYTRDVYRSDDAGDTWYASSQNPSGPGDAGAYVVVDDDFFDNGKAWIATVGTTGDDQSAISLTNDYGKCWIQISMINTEIDTLKDGGLAFSPVFASDDTMFMITTSASAPAVDSLWRQDGEYWSRVHDTDTAVTDCDSIDGVQVSPDFAESNTVYLVDKNSLKVWYSKDGGFRFIAQSDEPTAFTGGWIVLDYNTVLVGAGSGAIYKATRRDGARYSKKTASGFGTIESFAVSPDYDNDTKVLCGDNEGRVGLSTNSGSTWKQKPAGVKAGAAICYVAFDSNFADNNIIYAADTSDMAVYRLEVDEDTSWSQINAETDTTSPAEPVAFDAAPSGIVAANGAVYCAVEKEAVNAIVVSRSINPTASTTSSRGVFFEPMKTSFTGDETKTSGIWLTGGDSNILWIEEVADSGGTNAIWKYEDALIVAPTLTEPEEGVSTGRTGTATLKWEKMDGATRYVIWVASNEDFSPLVTTDTTPWTDTAQVSSTASYSVTNLSPGSTYYWKMRSADSINGTTTALRGRALSPWSEVWSFTTGIGEAEWNPFSLPSGVGPSAGASDVPLRPAFQWNAADWATAYEFVLAKDAAFTDKIKEFIGASALTDTIYALDTDLAYSTSYYWKVRAISEVTESNWGVGVFTTMEAEAVVYTCPQCGLTFDTQAALKAHIAEAHPLVAPEEPVTPSYVWAIIAIGAVLVIALIILIVRTRRAV